MESHRYSPKWIASVIVFIILTIGLCCPLPYKNYGFFYFGFLPAPFAHWILFTLLYVAFIIYVSFIYDPYREWSEKLEQTETQNAGQ